MRTRVTAMAGASLFATTGLLGAYVGYPGLRRASAATISCTVTQSTDTPFTPPATAVPGELRYCLGEMDGDEGTITFDPSVGTVTLADDLPTVTQTGPVTITGAGQGQTIISGADLHRAFYFDGNTGDVSFSNLTIQNADLGVTGGPKGGSAIYSSTIVSLSNVTLSNNKNLTGTDPDEGVGAAVWAGNGAVVTASRFTGNVATQFGGAIYSQAGNITITGSYFADNDAGYDGGAIWNYGGDSTITGSTFKRNEATSDGGAIFSYSSDSITITGSTFENNTATNADGGAIWNNEGDITITGSYFTTNTATGGIGGAIFNEGSDITITGGTFSNNQAVRGGAVYNDRGDITITSSYFTTNQATGFGGGAVRSGGSTAIEGSTFTDNSAIEAGGAVWSEEGASITDSTFDQNVAGSGYSGGAVFVDYLGVSASVDVVNSTFTDNTADAGSALYVYGDDGSGTLRVNFSTVTGNTARTAGGAAIEASDLYALDFVITNSILFGNLDSGSTPLDVETNGNLELAFSLLTTPTSFSAATTTPLPSNLLDGDPLLAELADNGGPTLTMLPAADSPVIGMANPTGAPATDQRGFTRTTNGLADMGSVERGGTAPEPDLSQMPPAWFQAQQRREQSATCPPGMVPSWAQWPNEGTGGWTCEWTTWWDVHKGSTGGWVTTPGFNPGLRRPE